MLSVLDLVDPALEGPPNQAEGLECNPDTARNISSGPDQNLQLPRPVALMTGLKMLMIVPMAAEFTWNTIAQRNRASYRIRR